jgi:hypothetical protein
LIPKMIQVPTQELWNEFSECAKAANGGSYWGCMKKAIPIMLQLYISATKNNPNFTFNADTQSIRVKVVSKEV